MYFFQKLPIINPYLDTLPKTPKFCLNQKNCRQPIRIEHEERYIFTSPSAHLNQAIRHSETLNSSRLGWRTLLGSRFETHCRAYIKTSDLPVTTNSAHSSTTDVLSSHDQETYPTTSLDENSIDYAIETDRKTYVNSRKQFWAMELKLVIGRSSEIYSIKKFRKSTRKKRKGCSVPWGTERRYSSSPGNPSKQPFIITFSPNLRRTSTISKFTSQIDS